MQLLREIKKHILELKYLNCYEYAKTYVSKKNDNYQTTKCFDTKMKSYSDC